MWSATSGATVTRLPSGVVARAGPCRAGAVEGLLRLSRSAFHGKRLLPDAIRHGGLPAPDRVWVRIHGIRASALRVPRPLASRAASPQKAFGAACRAPTGVSFRDGPLAGGNEWQGTGHRDD